MANFFGLLTIGFGVGKYCGRRSMGKGVPTSRFAEIGHHTTTNTRQSNKEAHSLMSCDGSLSRAH